MKGFLHQESKFSSAGVRQKLSLLENIKLTHLLVYLQSCWNCGRKASETCSGCNTARYCGSFCQHKDWENHHHVCGKATMSALSQIRETPPQTVTSRPSGSASATPPHNSPSPTNSVASVKSASRSSTPAEARQVEVTH